MDHIVNALIVLLLLQSPVFSGTWEGAFNHEGRIEQMAFVFQQHDSTLTGESYRGGDEFAPVENGHVRGDSASFTIAGLAVAGRLDGDRLAVVLTVYNGTRYPFVMARRR